MKYFVLIILFFALALDSQSQSNCELSSSCLNEPYPYSFCDPAIGRVYRCSANPYNERNSGDNSLIKPFKLDINCLLYDQSSFEQPTYTEIIHHPADTAYVDAYHDEVLDSDDNGDIYGWNDGQNPCGIDRDDYPCYSPFYTREIDYIDPPWDDSVKHPCDNAFRVSTGGDLSFDPNQVDSDLSAAISNWTSLCVGCPPSQQAPKNCCSAGNYVKVSWSRTEQDFKVKGAAAKDVAAVTMDLQSIPAIGACDPPCSSLHIKLNQSDAFTGATELDPCNYHLNFFFTGSIVKRGDNGAWFNLTAVLTHEIGHLLGFADQYTYNNESNSYLSDCFHTDGLFTDGSIMCNQGFRNTSRGLSSDDKCMYKKLYCSNLTSGIGDEFKSIIDLTVFPNPANNDLINVRLGNLSGINMTYDIISPLGRAVSSGNIQPDENAKTITLGSLPSGAYYIVLKHDGKQEPIKFIINK